MANSPDTQVDCEVREGLLCPICLYDLKTVNQLQEHFELAHSTDDQDVFQTLKGFLGKAKRKILKQDIWPEESTKLFDESSSIPSAPLYSPEVLSSPQEIGTIACHTSAFKKLRDHRIDRYVIETNKLLIRLDKLICDAPDDPEKRKAHERSVVPWIPDSDVRLCPGCAKSFGLSRRRHHCRLCGGVLCHSCSQFIDFHFARKLTQPIVHDDQLSTSSIAKPLVRRGSNSSLLSVVNLAGEPHIRMCRDCKTLLTRREQQLEQQSLKPVIVQKYERMKNYMTEVSKLAPLYNQMIDSLSSGETVYHLRDAQEVKIKLSKMAEGIDTISKIILRLGSSESGNKAEPLQSSIRMAASQFLKNTVLGLPALPTEQEIIQYQRLRQEQVQRRIQQEKEASLQLCAKNISSAKNSPRDVRSHISPTKQNAKEQVSVDAGWSASPGKLVQEDDPMLQQINIIHKYIKQAQLDHKYDEVHMLEANLKELQLEYMRQQQQMSPT